MSDLQIIRPILDFEKEYGRHRNWWARDARIVGNPLSVLLYLLSHEATRMPTQTEARRELGLGKDAWISAKKHLLEAGFIVEIRDRYPSGYRDSSGRPKGGQRRFRLFLQDPDQGYSIEAKNAVIELEEPYEEFLAAQEGNHVGFSEVVEETPDHNQGGLSAVGGQPAAGSPTVAEPALATPTSFKEEKTRLGLVGYLDSSNQPTNQTTREVEIDSQLEALAPGCGLTLAALELEISGRVDLSMIDVIKATRETLLRSKDTVDKPASYVASVVARYPKRWLVEGDGTSPYVPAAAVDTFDPEPHAVDCARGKHWWGGENWAEIDRSHCAHCGQPRRDVDPVFEELEREMLSTGGGY